MELQEEDRIGSFTFCQDVSEENLLPLSRQLHEIQPLQGPPLLIFPTRWIIDLMIAQISIPNYWKANGTYCTLPKMS